MLGVNDKSTGQIVKPDGSRADVPSTMMSVESAQILRAYFAWAMAHQLEPELYCGNCFNGSRDDKAIYNITDTEIQIVCSCQLRVFMGATMNRPKPASSVTIANDSGVGSVLLSEDTARLLRLYDKHVLRALNLKEALRCNACYALENQDGCEASVLTSSILIRCRCSRRTYQGTTL